MLLDSLLKLSVVDEAILVYAVGNKVVVLAGLVDRRAVAQVTALRQIHTHNGVAQIEQSEVNRKVGLCTGVRLNIRYFAPNSSHARSIAMRSTLSTNSQPP